MRLKKSFENFLRDTINLDQTRLDRIRSAHTTIRDKLTALDEVKKYYVTSYLQGSYPLGTVIRPCDENAEYDVDVVLALNLEDQDGNLFDGPSVLDWLYLMIDGIPLYKGKVERRERCVRVQYESDSQRFHLDVLPAHQPVVNDDPILIPPDWAATNPRAYIKWLNDRQQNHCARVRHIVRLLKYWRNLQSGSGLFGLNSMVLTTLVGHHAPKDGRYKSLDEALVKTMASINDWLQDLPAFEQVVVENPSLDGENLARNWSWVEVSSFRTTFANATALAEEAYACKDEKLTIEVWNDKKLFDGCFPKTLQGLDEEAKAVAKAMQNGGLYTGASGLISMNLERGSVRMRDNRGYFGRSED